jgi:hypothetical protein
MRIGNRFLRTFSATLSFGNRTGRQNSGSISVPIVGDNLYQGRFSLVFIFSIIIFASIFLTIFETYGIIRASLAATGAWLSTMVAFRWIWDRRYEWGQYFISLRPMFQTISFMYLILGPLPPLLGLPQYVFNYGVKDFYWVLYLASPLAFLAYEYGYGLGIGKLPTEIRLPDLKTDFNFPGSLILLTFAIVVVIYYYMSEHVGFYGGGFKGAFVTEQGELVKAMGFLFKGIAAVTILLAFNNIGKNGFYNKFISIFVIISVIMIAVLMHNRRMAIIFVIICLSCIQMTRKTQFIKNVILFSGSIMLIYIITTAIRTTLPSHFDSAGASFTDKLAFSKEALTDNATKKLFEKSLRIDLGYRLDAFDESAAILKSHEGRSIPYMWGENFLMGAYQSVPAIFITVPKKEPEETIINHFELEYFDQISTLFSSALADGGIIGIPLAFIVLGLIHGYLWRHWSRGKKSGFIALGPKCSYFAMIPYLLTYEDYMGSYLALGLRYWLIFTIVFTSMLACYAISPRNYFIKKRRVL